MPTWKTMVEAKAVADKNAEVMEKMRQLYVKQGLPADAVPRHEAREIESKDSSVKSSDVLLNEEKDEIQTSLSLSDQRARECSQGGNADRETQPTADSIAGDSEESLRLHTAHGCSLPVKEAQPAKDLCSRQTGVYPEMTYEVTHARVAIRSCPNQSGRVLAMVVRGRCISGITEEIFDGVPWLRLSHWEIHSRRLEFKDGEDGTAWAMIDASSTDLGLSQLMVRVQERLSSGMTVRELLSPAKPLESVDDSLGELENTPPPNLVAARAKLSEARESDDQAAEGLALLELAEFMMTRARYSKALAIAVSAYGRFVDALSSLRTLRLIVKLHLAQEKYDDALKISLWSQNLFSSSSSEGIPAVAHMASLMVVDVYLAMDRPQEAIQAATDVVDGLADCDDKASRMTALESLAFANLALQSPLSFKAGFEKAVEALEISRELEDSNREVMLLLCISDIHLQRSETIEAFAMAKTAQMLGAEKNHPKGTALALRKMAEVMLESQEEPSLVLNVVKEALAGFQYIGDAIEELSTRHVIAQCHKQDGLISFALEALGEALNLAWELKDRVQIEKTLTALAKIHSPAQALATMNKEMALAEKLGDVRRQLMSSQLQADIQISEGSADAALKTALAAVKTAEDAKALQESKGTNAGLALALQVLAQVHSATQRYDQALEAASRARDLMYETRDMRGIVGILRRIIAIYALRNDTSSATKTMLELVATYRAAGWKYKEAHALMQTALLQMDKAGSEAGVATARKAIELSRSLGDKVGEAETLLVIARHQLESGKREEECLTSANYARGLFKDVADVSGEAKALMVIAEVHASFGRSAEAVGMIRESVVLAGESGDRNVVAELFRSGADAHLVIVQSEAQPSDEVVETAHAFIVHALKFHQQEISDKTGQAMIWVQLANLYAHVKNGEEALKAAKESFRLAETQGGTLPNVEASALLAWGRASILLKDRDTAVEVAQDAIKVFQDMLDQDGVRDAKNLLSEARKLSRPPKRSVTGPRRADDVQPPRSSDLLPTSRQFKLVGSVS